MSRSMNRFGSLCNSACNSAALAALAGRAAAGAGTRAHLALVLLALTSMSVLSGCPTEGNLGELTFEQIDDVAFGREFDSENGDAFLDEGRWAVGSSLRVRIDTADPNAALPVLECAADDLAVLDVQLEGADILNIAPVGQGETLVSCSDAATGETVDYIAMAAGVPATLAAWFRVPYWLPRYERAADTGVITLIDGGAIDLGIQVLDASGGHLRGNEDLVPAPAEVTVASVGCDAGLGCLSNHFNVLTAEGVGSSSVDYSLYSDASVSTIVAVDVVDPATDLSSVGYRFIDSAGNELAAGAPIPDGALLIVNAFLLDGTTEAWGGEYAVTVNTASTIAVLAPAPATATEFAWYVDGLQSGPASVTVDLVGSALSGQIDFDIVAD